MNLDLEKKGKYMKPTTEKSEFERIEHSAVLRRKTVHTVIYILLSVWGLVVLFPFYWMILTSVKSYGEYNSEYIPKFYETADKVITINSNELLNRVEKVMKRKLGITRHYNFISYT